MTRREIFTYKKSRLREYINQREKEDIAVVTLAQIEKKGLDEYLNDLDTSIDIDLTSTIKIINNGGNYANYSIESIIESLDDYGSVTFIVDEIYEQDLLSELPYFFCSIIPIEFDTEEIFFVDEFGKKGKEEKKRKIVDLDEIEKKELFRQIQSELIGHTDLKSDLINKINEFCFYEKVIEDQPIISLFLLGSSGLGKTELARVIHNYLDEKTPLAKINFANYANESALASLIGSPPGYYGSGEESDLIKKIKSSGTGVLLVDEFEKANGRVRNFFLQLLEEGKFDDALGQIYDLGGYLIIFTSNLNRENFSKEIPAELRSRFNGVYLMKELSFSEKHEYANKIIDWYFEKSGEGKCEDKRNRILRNVNLEKESNLRTIKFRLRSAFFEVNFSGN